MRRDLKTFIVIASSLSLVFAILLFAAIHSRYGTCKSLLYCLIGVIAIWVFGYLKARLFGWIGPGSSEDDEPERS